MCLSNRILLVVTLSILAFCFSQMSHFNGKQHTAHFVSAGPTVLA